MAAPELRLNVTLDLAFFRTQVQKLTAITQSEFAPKLNVKFNRQILDAELNNLQRAIKRRVYRIEIGGNIDTVPEKIQGIKEGLAALETQKKVEIPIGIKNGVTQKDATTVVAAMYKKIRESALENTGGKIRIPVSIKPSITTKDVADFKKAVKDSLSGISINVKANVQGKGFAGSEVGAAGLMEYMKKEGMIGKTASGMQMRMKNESNDKGRIQRSALDQLARAIFFMAGIDPSQIRVKRRQIPDVDWASTIPSRPPSIGPSSSGRALPFGAIPSSLPGTAFGSQKYLPTALGEELKQILRGAAYAFVDSFKQNIRTVKVTESPQSLLGGRVPAGLLPGRPSQANVLELNNILAGAIREYFKAVARGVTAQAGGAFKPTKQSLLPGARVAGLLTPSVGRTPSRYSAAGETTQELFARREREARMRSALRSVDTLREGGVAGRAPSPYSTAYRGARSREAIVPYAAGGALVQSGGGGAGGGNPPRPPSGGGRGGGFLGGMQFNMPQLPGAGIVQGLGTEFAFAAKQVLLFGTAYKALAFLTDFPSQVGSAVGQLQSFRNTLNAVSPSAQEAAQSSQFILDVVDKYNVPLQSARDGFTKLYASMQPAGFGGNEIRDLFLGISQAAATFGMSADKVDRVNYAFAQMASKGQVMSEELKGQLGDVLPGSMALFAEAAGFKGPQAITKFSKALEDGVYKGSAMKTLLTNVGIVMRKEFGPGAEGAAKTFQGSINRMQNSLKLLYEAFEPVAVGFLNAVVMPMTSGIKTLTDGFNAFFTGQAAQTAGGNALAQQLKDLKPSFDGILVNLKELIPSFQLLGNVILNAAKILTVIAGNPIVGFLLKIYTNILLVNGVFTLLGGRVLVSLISSLGAAIAKFIALNFAVASLQRTSVVANSTLAGTQLQLGLLSRGATGALGPLGLLKTALLGLARFGVILVGIEIVISGFAELDRLNKSLDKIAGFSSKQYTAEVKGLSKEDVNSRIIVNRKAQLSATKELKQFEGLAGKAKGLVSGRDEELRNRMVVMQTQGLILESAKNNKSQAQLDKERTEKELAKIKLEGGDGGKAAEREAERQAKLQDKLANRQDQLALEAANRQVALDQSTFDSRLRMSDAEYDHERALQDDYFERKMSGLDSIEARQKKFQQDLQAIENRRIDSIRKAELDAVKAVQDLRSASIKAAAVTGSASGDSSKYVDRSVLRKYLESEGFGRTSGDFTNKGHKTPDHMRNAMDYGIMGGSDADALRKTIAMERKLKATGAFGDQLFGPERDPYGHGAGKGGQNIHLHIPTPDGKIKLTPGLSNLIGGEGLQSSAVGLNTRSGAFAMGRREDKLEGQLAVEQQDAQNKALEKLETIRRANNLALEQTITLVKQNIDSIFPVKEQQLENDLLEMRNNLELKGTSKEIIDMEVQKYKAVKENAHNLQMLNEKIAKNNEELTKLKGKKITTEEEKEQIKFLTDQIKAYKLAITGIPEQQRLFNEQLEKTAALAVESPMVKLAKQLNETKKELIEIGSASSIAIGSAKAIGEAFGNSFKSMISGSATVQQSFASLFQSVGDYFLDMASRIITKYIEMQAIQGLMNIFKMFTPGVSAGGVSGVAPAPSNLQPGADFGLPGIISTGMVTAANGAVWQGGFTAFASGGIVQGPTLGLVGEGKYNEAIIPLPNGKSVPVDLGGMSDGLGNNITSNIVVNVSSDGQSTSNANGSNSVDLGRKIEGAVKQVIVAELRPGGVLAGRR